MEKIKSQSSDWSQRSKLLWSSLYKIPLAKKDMNEISNNLVNFFSILNEWDNNVKKK